MSVLFFSRKAGIHCAPPARKSVAPAGWFCPNLSGSRESNPVCTNPNRTYYRHTPPRFFWQPTRLHPTSNYSNNQAFSRSRFLQCRAGDGQVKANFQQKIMRFAKSGNGKIANHTTQYFFLVIWSRLISIWFL